MLARFHRLAFTVCLLLASLTTSATPRDFELPFWPTPGAERDSRVLRTEDGACGGVVIAKVRVMPNPNKGDVLATDVVYELTAQSRILRRWYVPANALPIATTGEELVFNQNRETFAVTTSGAIRIMSLAKSFPESIEVKCRLPKAFNDSGYARCHLFPQVTGEKRTILAFQGPCT